MPACKTFGSAVAACLALAKPVFGAAIQGKIVNYVAVSSTLENGQCEFAGGPVNGSEPILANYLRSGMHCGIGNQTPSFGDGELCGGCYRVRSTRDTGVNGDKIVSGKMSEAVVMVSTGIEGGGAGFFDCFPQAFQAITGAEEGEFPIELEQAECDQIEGTPTVVNFGGKDQYFCKVVFENIAGWGTLSSVEGCLGNGRSNCREMIRLGGQAWTGCPVGSANKITFILTQTSPAGEEKSVQCICSGEWPWESGGSCTCGVNFAGISLTETSPTRTTTTATTMIGQVPDDQGNAGGGEGGNDKSDSGPGTGGEGGSKEGSEETSDAALGCRAILAMAATVVLSFLTAE